MKKKHSRKSLLITTAGSMLQSAVLAVKVTQTIRDLSFRYGRSYLEAGACESSIIDWFERHYGVETMLDIGEVGQLPVLFYWFKERHLIFTTEGIFQPVTDTIQGSSGELKIIRLRRISFDKIRRCGWSNPEFGEVLELDLQNLFWRMKHNLH